MTRLRSSDGSVLVTVRLHVKHRDRIYSLTDNLSGWVRQAVEEKLAREWNPDEQLRFMKQEAKRREAELKEINARIQELQEKRQQLETEIEREIENILSYLTYESVDAATLDIRNQYPHWPEDLVRKYVARAWNKQARK